MTDGEFATFLVAECGYREVKRLADGRWGALYPLAYTTAIVAVEHGDTHSVAGRWCYHTAAAARAALAAWDGAPGTEPQGWHRDPFTGRRRTDGNPAMEYVAP